MSDAKPAPNERQATRRIDTAGPDYGKPTGPVGRFRARLRVFLENLKVEFFTMGVVIISPFTYITGVSWCAHIDIPSIHFIRF